MTGLRISLLLLFLSPYAIAQEFKTISINKGLPSKEIYDILQDRRGYIWFATDRGVARYNGKDFRTYTKAQGLIDNTVFRMCEDHKGRIWFASQSNDLCYWFKDTIHHLASSAVIKSIIPSDDVINKIYADTSDNLWINFRNVALFSDAKKNYTTFEEIKASPDCAYELRIIDGKTPICLFNRKIPFTPLADIKKRGSWPIIFNFHKKENPSQLITYNLDSNNTSPPYITSARAYSPKSNTYYFSLNNVLLWTKSGRLETQVLQENIINIITDREGNVWVGLQKKGVAFYKNGDFSKTPITCLDGITVDDVLTDHEGGVWLATLERGVFYIPSTSVVTYPDPLLNDHITFIGEIDGKIYASTGSYIVQGDRRGFERVNQLMEIAKQRGMLYSIKQIRDTTYTSFSGELVRFRGEMNNKNKLPQKNSRFQGEFSGAKALLETPDGGIWLIAGGGLKKINNQTCGSVAYNAPFRVTTAIANGNDIYVGGKSGMYIFKDGDYSSMSSIDPLLKNQIIEMVKDATGTLWIATIGEGVLRLKNNRVKQITEKNGLISNICTCITTDGYGNVWVGTNKGISCIQNANTENGDWKLKNMDERNGLSSDDITRLFSAANFVWAGTMLGVNCIDIKNTLAPIPASPVYIDSITVNGIPANQRTEFSYKENDLLFKLHSLSYKNMGEHQYRFRLTQLDTTWRMVSSDEILLSRLNPGKYTFRVQAANIDNTWSNIAATYSFVINKPFWLTWWFISAELIVLILIVYLIIRWRTAIVKRKEAEKLRINNLLTEYQMKALTAQMNPHFIFNAINSIQNFIIQNHSTLAYDYLIKFSKLIRLVLNNSKDNEITLQQELDTLKLYIELEQLRFKESFEFRLSVDPDMETTSLLIPSLLLQPYIENAIWHGLMPLKTRKGIITLTINQLEQILKITITDNGIGREASNLIKKKITRSKHESMGMELTGKRIELFGKENRFSIQLIDNHDNDNHSTGTTVEIILPMVEMY